VPQSERGYQYERGKGSFPRDLMDKDEGVQSLYQPPREGTQGVLGGKNARILLANPEGPKFVCHACLL
jgi:hypothetical protein